MRGSHPATRPSQHPSGTIGDLGSQFDEIADHVIITSSEGDILYANKAVERVTGFSIDETLGKNPGALWGGMMEKTFYEDMWRTIKEEKKAFVGEVRNKRKDGTTYWQELHISPVLNARDEVEYFIAIELDITERKEREKSRDEFISMVSHQLRNPIQTIGLLTELLSQSKTITAEDKKSIEAISSENRGLFNVIKDLLTLSKLGRSELGRELVDLEYEIEKIISDVRIKNPTVKIAFHKKGRGFILFCNKSLGTQIFSNLIYNAAEYSDTEVEVTLEKKGRRYVFSCRNNGLGISEQDKKNIFTSFFRSALARKRKESGSGLGLHIVKTIADELGWDVWFESGLDTGTIFYVKTNTLLAAPSD